MSGPGTARRRWLRRLLDEGHAGVHPRPGAVGPADREGERGIALLLVLAMIVFMTAYVVDFNYQARVKYIQAANSRDQARSYYLAKSGVQIYILLLSFGRAVTSDEFTRSILTQFGLNPDDALWQSIPFIDSALLRALVVGGTQGGASGAEEAARQARSSDGGEGEGGLSREEIDASREAGGSAMRRGFLDFDGDFKAEVSDEDRKINLNLMADMAGTAGALNENPVALELFGLMSPRQYDKLFTDELKIDRWELIGNLLDWIDPDTQRSGGYGGYEDSLYDDVPRFPYTTRNSKFDTVAETQVVAGVTDKVYALFSPSWTVFGSGKVNVNTADASVVWGLLRAFSEPSATDETVAYAVQQVLTQRTLFRFKNANDFVSLVSSFVPLKDNGTPLKNAINTTSKTFNLRSTGTVNDASATVEVILTYSSGAKYRIESWKEQ